MRHFFDETLSLYLDGRCNAKLSSEIEAHIKRCSICRNKFSGLKLTKKIVGALEEIDVSEGFDFEFNRRLEKAIEERNRRGILEKAAEWALAGVRALIPPVPILVKVAVAAIIVLTVGVETPYYFAKMPIDVTAVHGKAELYSERGQEWIAVTGGMRLAKGDILKTEAEAYVDIGIDGLFAVRVKGGTELKALSMLPRFKKGTVAYEVARGEVLIDITEEFEGSRFEVYTPQAIAKALGTSFAVDVSGDKRDDETWLAVLEGTVEVESRYPLYASKENRVIVKGGQKTTVSHGEHPIPVAFILEKEVEKLKGLYDIGLETKVILLMSQSELRVRELLRPCGVYISGKKGTIPERLEEAIAIISEAVEEGSEEKHLEAIRQIERMIAEYPEEKYNEKLLLFTATYNNSLGKHEEAIAAFDRFIKTYPDSQFASLAQCAIGIIYNEGLGEKARAAAAFRSVDPDSLEGLEAEKGLKELGY